MGQSTAKQNARLRVCSPTVQSLVDKWDVQSMTFNMTNVLPRNNQGLAFVAIKTSGEQSSCDLGPDSQVLLTLHGTMFEKCETNNLNSDGKGLSADSFATFNGDLLGECNGFSFPNGLHDFGVMFIGAQNDLWCVDFVDIVFHDNTIHKCNIQKKWEGNFKHEDCNIKPSSMIMSEIYQA